MEHLPPICHPKLSLLFQNRSQSSIDAHGGVFLHARHHVLVKVHGCSYRRMSGPFAGDLGVYTSAQQICQVSMPQSMECHRADTSPLNDLRKCMREGPGADGRTIEPGMAA